MKISEGQRVLGAAFILTLAFLIIELIGAKLSGSLALLADAGHMFSDLAGIGLALFASWMISKRPTRKMSYGFYRLEILAALVNGALLLALAFLITKEAVYRLERPPAIRPALMLAVGAAGLAGNLICAFLLKKHSADNINIRGAFFHVVGDALSSAGAVVAAVVIAVTGWAYADPLVSFFIASLIVVSGWRLLKDVAEVLLEATPARINVEDLERKILSVPGLLAIHDLHIWSITSGKEALSAHLEVGPGAPAGTIRDRVNEILARDFEIYHTTLQVEDTLQRKKEIRHFHD